MSTTHGDERMSFRVDRAKKQAIERAAAIKGLSVTEFAVMTLYREATEVIKGKEVLSLSDRDRDAFLAALDNPPKPAAKLLRAAAAYKAARTNGALDDRALSC